MCLNEKIAESFIDEVLKYFEKIEIPTLRSVVKNEEYLCYKLGSKQISTFEVIPNAEIDRNFMYSFELIESLYENMKSIRLS